MERSEAFRALPAVHKLLDGELGAALAQQYPRDGLSNAIAIVLDELRQAWEDMHPDESVWTGMISEEAIFRRVEAHLEQNWQPSLRPVLNLTGVVIHTNLGRAPLSSRALEAVVQTAQGYSNLEYQIEAGVRGSRHAHLERLLCQWTGAEAAMVVNNNAAAVFLILRELGAAGEAIVSRGELVEIGGSFRIPAIMAESGVRLREVGTTNKTRVSDYEEAICDDTRLLLRVHPSNFRIIGFTHRPHLRELCDLGRTRGIPVYEDLGSGALLRLPVQGLAEEPLVQESIAAGVDVVSFSGDKLLGGAQAGIIAGRKAIVDRLKKNQLARALRVDKMTLAALEATLLEAQDPRRADSAIPVLRMLTETESAVYDRAAEVLQAVSAGLTPKQHRSVEMALVHVASCVGGGALPDVALPSTAIAVTVAGCRADGIAAALRTNSVVPVVCRIEEDRVLLDLRTLQPHEHPRLISAMIQTLNVLLSKCD